MLSHDHDIDTGARMRQPPARPDLRRVTATLALTLSLSGACALATPPVALEHALPLVAMIAGDGPSEADAGTWAQVTCTQPVAGLPQAPTEGWVAGNGGGTATQGCDPYTGGLIAAIPDTTSFGDGAGASWTYTAPAGSTIAGGQVVAQLYAPQGLAYVSTGAASAAMASCQGGSPCGGTVGGSTGVVTLPIAPIGGTTISEVVECTAPSSGTLGSGGCPAGQGGSGLDAEAQIYQAVVDLTNNATPTATNFGGGLLAAGPVSGQQVLTLTATDGPAGSGSAPGASSGPGVYQVEVQVDGQVVYDQTPDTNSGHCVPIGTDPAGVLEWLYQAPCKASLDVSVPVDTSGLADGPHNLTIKITDAALNTSVFQQSFTSLNHTTVSAGLNTSTPAPAAPTVAAPAPAPVYAIVLDPATQALIHGVTRGYESSALTLSGALRNSAGLPAPGVPVTLFAANGAGGASQAIARGTSDGAGHWTLPAPKGPSRVLTIAYGAQAQTASAATDVTINETVTPALSFAVRALSRGRLRFTGQLKVTPIGTPRPQVLIQTGKANHWQTLGDPVTVSSTGRYTLNYASSPATIGYTFQFRAVSAATTLYTKAVSTTRKEAIR
jgi:hypothetical protein